MAIIAHYLNLVANVRLTHLVDVPGFVEAKVPDDNAIDKAVFAKLNRMRIPPSDICTDREFIRRIYLDVLGVLPTPEEVRAISCGFSRDASRPTSSTGCWFVPNSTISGLSNLLTSSARTAG